MDEIRFGSVCSGIEAASVAWHPLGWIPAWFAEIEPFPGAVLAHHWPKVPNLGDFTAIRDKIAVGAVEAPDVLVGGTPCQAFSIAGLRQSLDDKRGQLTLEFVRIADALDSARSLRGQRPITVVWENVPGVLNTPDNAFGCFLAGLVGEDVPLEPPGGRWSNVGYVRGPTRTAAWRILDAQYFGVAQRRRRVFVVASAGGIRPEKVLFELDGVRRDSAPRREAGQGASPVAGALAASGGGLNRPAGNANELDFCIPVAPTLQAGGKAAGSATKQDAESGALVVQVFGGNRCSGPIDVSPALNACGTASGRQDFESEAFIVGQGFHGDVARTLTYRHDSSACVDRGMDVVAVGVREVAPTITRNYGKQPDSSDTSAGPMVVPVGMLAIRGRDDGSSLEARYDGTSNAILTPSGGRAGMGVGAIHYGMQVRRLTPTECERLQGFPDGHTLIPWRGKPADECPDGPRYKALGNSMAVPVMRWIGERIAKAQWGANG